MRRKGALRDNTGETRPQRLPELDRAPARPLWAGDGPHPGVTMVATATIRVTKAMYDAALPVKSQK